MIQKKSGVNNGTTESQKDTSFEIGFDVLFTPDPDFDKRIDTPEILSGKEKASLKNNFPGLNLDAFQIEELPVTPLKKPINHFKTRFKKLDDTFPQINIDTSNSDMSSPNIENNIPQTNIILTNNIENTSLQSVLEKELSFYSNRFQQILSLYPITSPENTIKRYAKILLYMMEQFHVHSEKAQQYKFILELKKVLGENLDIQEENDYIETLKTRGYINPSGQLKEEIEFLYNLYYDCYVIAEKEYNIYLKAEQTLLRKRLQNEITLLEKEMLPHFDFEAPGYDSRNLLQHTIKQRLLEKRNLKKSDKN